MNMKEMQAVCVCVCRLFVELIADDHCVLDMMIFMFVFYLSIIICLMTIVIASTYVYACFLGSA